MVHGWVAVDDGPKAVELEQAQVSTFSELGKVHHRHFSSCHVLLFRDAEELMNRFCEVPLSTHASPEL